MSISWFNWIGLIIIIIMMIPNILFAIFHKDKFENKFQNKYLEVIEQTGRIGTFTLMVFNIPYTCFYEFIPNYFLIYVIGNSILLFLYLLGWIICWNKYQKFKAYFLSIVPCTLFLYSGFVLLNIPLIVLSIIFSIGHITISLKNVYA